MAQTKEWDGCFTNDMLMCAQVRVKSYVITFKIFSPKNRGKRQFLPQKLLVSAKIRSYFYYVRVFNIDPWTIFQKCEKRKKFEASWKTAWRRQMSNNYDDSDKKFANMTSQMDPDDAAPFFRHKLQVGSKFSTKKISLQIFFRRPVL
jgi:hypothetical protein